MSTPLSSPNSPPSSASQPAPAGSASPAATCPRCARPIPAHAVLGACPHCLLAAGLISEPAAPTNAAPPPSPAELAPEFPQLDILELLGRGGMGAVYKARQKSLDRLVALKLLRPGLDADPSFAERFTREARALAQLNHPGIVTLYEFGRTPGGLFFIQMEFVDGLNLRQLLAAGRLSPREALAIIPPLCDALQYAHDRGLVHRDIKPENILIDRLGRVKIADFGLAKLAPTPASSASPRNASPADTLSSSATDSDIGHWSLVTGHSADGETAAGQVFGMPGYMAPEQRERPAAVDHRADIYALGVVLYQMLTGELPDTKQLQPPSRRVHIDIRLDQIVLRALEANPALRYAAASEFKTQIETVTATATPSAGSADGPSAFVSPDVVTPENPVQKISAPPPFRASTIFSRHRLKFWLLRVAPLTLLVVLALRFFVIAPYRIATSSVEPEIPADSLAFVYKLDRHFAPGDIVAYRHSQSLVYVGRVDTAHPVDGKIFIARENQGVLGIPPKAVIGKVIFHTRPSRKRIAAIADSIPNSSAPRRFPNDPIRIRDDGTYEIGTTKVSLTELTTHLARIGKEAPDATVALHTDEKAAYTLMPEIMTTARRLGISKIAFKEFSSETHARYEKADNIATPATTSIFSTPRLQFREVLPAPSNTTENLSLNKAGREETLHVDVQILMDEKDVSSIENKSENGLLLRLTPLGTQRFAEITRALVGKRLALLFDGRVLIAPHLHEPITGGAVRITGRFSPEEIDSFKKSLREAITPPPPQTTQSPDTFNTEQAIVWLREIDDGQYAKIWQTASATFRKNITETKWTETLTSTRAPLGKVLERGMTHYDYERFDNKPPELGTPKVTLTFYTRFENGRFTETASFTRDPDSTWRALAYLIEPRTTPAPPDIDQLMKEWLSQIDEARYAENWAGASPLFKKSLSQSQWETMLKSVRTPLGQVLQRGVTYVSQLNKLQISLAALT